MPLLVTGPRPHGVILREQSREISPDEYRRCLELLDAVADGMDRRNAPLDECDMTAAFIRGQFAGCPEALHISNIRIGKGHVGWRRISAPDSEDATEC
jgi:hypothetical protein